MTNWQQIVSMKYDKCFGCGQANPAGLRLNFKWDGRTARAEFTPTELYQGWQDIVHGGIIAVMLDEAAGWAMQFEGLNPITTKMEIRFIHPAIIGKPLIITGSITKRNGKRVEAKASIISEEDTLIAECRATYLGIKADEETNVNQQG